jgi:MYXO-CTERM domain-containing protein
VRRVIDADAEFLFDAWTTREHLIAWWGSSRTTQRATRTRRVGTVASTGSHDSPYDDRMKAWLASAAILLATSQASAQAIFPLDHGKFPTTPTAPTIGGQVKYFGGRVISNVKIVEVAWNSSVDSAYLTQLQGFYTAIAPSAFVDWMTEYDTIGLTGFSDLQPGSNQHIGRGAYVSTVVLVPNNKSTTLTDADIQTELVAQLTSKALPAPSLDANGNVDSLYMIDFPSGTTITLVNIQSCSSFGAYHFTATYQGMSIPYGVHPDCGYNFQQATIVHSHELAEAMTDTEVGLVETNTTNLCVRPLAWTTYASTAWASQEIADICQGNYDQIAGYTVQKIWSNYAQGCVAQIPICDGVLAPPACRPCNEYDDEAACTNACATSGTKDGQCVACTSNDAKACSGATPACDDATYTCVACVKNDDCKNASTPICDTTHVCRGCTSDSDCTGGRVCDSSGGDAGADAGDAENGQCVACNTNAECQEDQVCTNHACVAEPIADAGSDVGDVEGASSSSGCGCVVTGARDAGSKTTGFALVALASLAAHRRRRIERGGRGGKRGFPDARGRRR